MGMKLYQRLGINEERIRPEFFLEFVRRPDGGVEDAFTWHDIRALPEYESLTALAYYLHDDRGNARNYAHQMLVDAAEFFLAVGVAK
jgi:hypothetical protein